MSKKLEVRIARLEERQRAADQAHKLHRKDTRGRLEDLNHAARTRDARDQNFVSNDKFDGLIREFHGYKETVNQTLHELEGRTAGLDKARSHLFQVIGVALLVITILIAVIAVVTSE